MSLDLRGPANPTINAQFGIYFDVTGPKGTDYRLLDANSQAAWREACSAAASSFLMWL